MKCPECKGTGKIELFTSTVDCTECVKGNVPNHDFVVPRSGGYIPPLPPVPPQGSWVPDEEFVIHVPNSGRDPIRILPPEDRVHRMNMGLLKWVNWMNQRYKTKKDQE